MLVARIVSYGCWRADPALHHGARLRTLVERRRAITRVPVAPQYPVYASRTAMVQLFLLGLLAPFFLSA